MAYMLGADYADAYESFLAYAKPRRSLQGYRSLSANTRLLLRWFEREEIDLSRAGITDCIRYKNDLGAMVGEAGMPLSAGTIRNRLKAGKSLFRYLAATGRIPADPFREVPYPRLSDRLSDNVLSEAGMGRLLTYLSHFDEEATAARRRGRYRLHVLGELLYATGLRITEAAALTPAHIDLRGQRVYVAEGKGRKARYAFLTGYAAEVMGQYLNRGRTALCGGHTYGHTVFGLHPGRLMAWANTELGKSCRKLGLPVITSHGFRHSLGTHLVHAGCDMRYIQALPGHESLRTTQVYTRIDKDALKDSLDAHHPRRRS
jgi:site-specific recombinase XerD